ncbi:SpoIIE family protein phosphatase [Blastococcus sp. TML/C7B]|uniref:GAF domain-containing SpoIIE family protein phosphatase n=1 Tax=Blastococcus sp. TML/C7B TaxID=2798728 RepID=UPI0019093264|nr:GAF domain-containing SpoIIE family protein phosphatase [Blastococcus sp. TML/C7B]MBN1095551.1 SpoIIE family protein phosphatase [Blastococcus sp. TML/C7B]
MSRPDGDRVLSSMPVGFMSVSADWVITHINPAAEQSLRLAASDLVGRDYWEAYPANLDNEFGRTYRATMIDRVVRTIESFYPEPLNRWYDVEAQPVDDGGLYFYFSDVTDRRVAQDRLALLDRVGAELAGTLDIRAAAARIPELVVPVLGHGALVTLLDEDGRPRSVGSWHVDPAARGAVERYAEVRLADLPADAPILRALRGGETVLLTAAEARASLPEGEARPLLASFGIGYGMTLPLRGHARVVGALTLMLPGTEPPEERHVATARQVADRIGLALDNARMYDQQRQLAEGLQRSLLTAPVQPPHAEIVVRYTPAAEAARVGGDWYDAFVQPSGRSVLVIGDVVGHDTEAAASMGQLRSLLRGIASYSDGSPAEVLRGLDGAMDQLRADTYATAAVASFEPADGDGAAPGAVRMRWSNAGHLPMLVIHPDGTLAELGEWQGDLMLGVDPGALRRDSEVRLAEGTTVLMFTDGLIERRTRDLDTGMARLRRIAGELADRPLAELCDEIIERMVDGRAEDDVALVAIRLRVRRD